MDGALVHLTFGMGSAPLPQTLDMKGATLLGSACLQNDFKSVGEDIKIICMY